MSIRDQLLCQPFTNTLTEFSHCSVREMLPPQVSARITWSLLIQRKCTHHIPNYLTYYMPLRKSSVPLEDSRAVVLKGGYFSLFWQWVRTFLVAKVWDVCIIGISWLEARDTAKSSTADRSP